MSGSDGWGCDGGREEERGGGVGKVLRDNGEGGLGVLPKLLETVVEGKGGGVLAKLFETVAEEDGGVGNALGDRVCWARNFSDGGIR